MKSLTKIQKDTGWNRRIKKADFSEKMRLHYYLGVILDDEDEVQEVFPATIQSEVLASTMQKLCLTMRMPHIVTGDPYGKTSASCQLGRRLE